MCPLFYSIFEVLNCLVEFLPASLAGRGGPLKGVTMSGALPKNVLEFYGTISFNLYCRHGNIWDIFFLW